MVDIGLATAAATANQLQSVLKLLPEEKGRPKFGSTVSPENESKCPYLEVFMACHRRMDKINVVSGHVELRRGRFDPNDTILDARAAFVEERGKELSQDCTADENGYILANTLLSKPMSTLSNGCRLNLNFVRSRNGIANYFSKDEDKAGTSRKAYGDSSNNDT